ncbi:MAG: hypothetical protein ACXACU_09895 [Candidatus Hodarchaeales archaeon]|jgi:presenilin-like A22 family membrane protease
MSEEMIKVSGSRFRAYILPIIFVIVLAIIASVFTLDYYAALQELEPTFTIPDMSPFQENPDDPGGIAQGAILNMLLYVVLVFLGGLVVLVIIKKGLMQFLAYFFAVIMGFSWFSFGFFYGYVGLVGILNSIWQVIPNSIQVAINNFFNWRVTIASEQAYVLDLLLLVFSISLGILGTLSFGIQSFDKIWVRNIMMIFFGAMIGSFLAIHFGLLTAFLILIGLSLYDIYAVFRGPLKGIIDHSREQSEEIGENLVNQTGNEGDYEKTPLLPALPVYSTPLINIGLGDFAFFSMLISASVIISVGLVTPIPLVAALIGLFTGVVYTYRLLTKERALPGLPLPIFCGIALLGVGVLIVVVLGITDLDSFVALFF